LRRTLLLRYVSKHEMQRSLSDLRGENFRLQRENVLRNTRADELRREVASRENALRMKTQESDNLIVEMEQLQKENEGTLGL